MKRCGSCEGWTAYFSVSLLYRSAKDYLLPLRWHSVQSFISQTHDYVIEDDSSSL